MKNDFISINSKPENYFSEETISHLRPQHGLSKRYLLRSLDAMLACKLTLTYGLYAQMMDCRELAMHEERMSYHSAELLTEMLNQLSEVAQISPSDLLTTQEEELDGAISKFKEYKDRLSAFEGNYYVPSVVEEFCMEVYKADDYYLFKAFCNLYYWVYSEVLLLYQIRKIDYYVFVKEFQELSLFTGKRKPLDGHGLKRYIRTMRKILDLYKRLYGNWPFK